MVYSSIVLGITSLLLAECLLRNRQPSYLLTSSHVTNRTKEAEIHGNVYSLDSCPDDSQLSLELVVPAETQPLSICLNSVAFSSSGRILHPNFKITEPLPDGQVKKTTLQELKEDDGALIVSGFILSLGYSYVSGTVRNGIFHGMLLYERDHSSMRFCTISPFAPLESVMDLSDYDEDERADLLENFKPTDESDSILSCEEEVSRPEETFERIMKKIKRRKTIAKEKRKTAIRRRRVKRSKPRHSKDDYDDGSMTEDSEDSEQSHPHRKEFIRKLLALRKAASGSRSLHSSSEDTDEDYIDNEEEEEELHKEAHKAKDEIKRLMQTTEKPWWKKGVVSEVQEEELKKPEATAPPAVGPMGRFALGIQKSGKPNDANSRVRRPAVFNGAVFSSNPAGRHLFLEVDIVIDQSIIGKHFQDLRSLASLLTSYVDITDWVTRAQDFDGDGTPDNIGFLLREIGLMEHKNDSESSGRNFRAQIVGEFFKERAKEFKKIHSIRIAIAALSSPLYVITGMTESGSSFAYDGCLACSHPDIWDGAINVNAAQYSARGETIRLFHAIMRILIHSIVYSKEPCEDCIAKDMGIAAVGGDTWGACLIEGSLFDMSNVPMNTFRLSNCSLRQGKECLKEVAERKVNAGSGSDKSCIQVETESNYCGNGIVEPGEECDCGTLTTCKLQRCQCGPRNGMRPCKRLSGAAVQVCEALIKCRGFRFIHEIGQLNASYFLDSLPALMQTRITGKNGGPSMGSFGAVYYIFIVAITIVIRT